MSPGRAGNRPPVARADWTYELPPATGDAVWLEEYLAYDADGEPAGKVFAVLDHGGRRYLGIEREHLPLRHDRRAVPFEAVRDVDHEHLAVHLSLSGGALDEALELDPGRGVEQGGEARRVAETPPGETPPARDAGAPGPVDRPEVIVSAILLLCSVMTLFGAIALYNAKPDPIRIVWFAIPIVLLLASLAVAYRAWSTPWRAGGAERPRESRRRAA